jgi:hypothetical protein
MTDRHALLIGVPRCDQDLFQPLDEVVQADITRMAEVLGQSDYRIRHCGSGDQTGREPTGSRIRSALIREFEEAPSGGVLLVYFSGHGVTIDGQSYLVPCDAYRGLGTERPDPDSLVPLVPRDLEKCPARLVAFMVDACREDPAVPIGSAPQGGALRYPAGGSFALVTGCQPGQRCLYADTGSFFTQALAEALDRRHPARSLDAVFVEVQRQLARKAARTEGMEQAPEIVWSHRGGQADAAGQLAICDGEEVTEAWRRAVEDAELWRLSAGGESATAQAKNAVCAIVDESSRAWSDAHGMLTSKTGIEDPWSDHDYPIRVLGALNSLLGEGVGLSPEEIAVLVAVPFLREAALAEGLREAAGVAPADFSRTYKDGPRADLELTHQMHEHVSRRAEGLARRKHYEARDALAMWLVHRWLGARTKVWESAAANAACARLAGVLIPASTGMAPTGSVVGGASFTRTPVTRAELKSILCALLPCVGADVGDRRVIDRLDRDDFDPRRQGLAALLWLAGIMAADLRRMPTVVVDHIGIGAELPMPALRSATARLVWRRVDDALDLQAVCDHAALHMAFEDLVKRAADARVAVGHLTIDDGIIRLLPAHFRDHGLRPEYHDGTAAYDLPLSRFRLSDEKVRELLMGRQLYGDPALAIRELYQNALDACRYRQIRRRYQTRSGEPVTIWTGAIEFSQGIDADGREYIECADNGVGMDAETLKHIFANAGERFVYRQGFRHEQAKWQELDPPLHLVPNSQFGVGVFSYFMIADEIAIITRPVSEADIVAAQAFSVRIASSGSLFQIAPSTEMPGGGTRVRLYLTGDERVSVLRTLRKLLWIAEYRVEVSEEGAGRETWTPDGLRYPEQTVPPRKVGEDLWWVSGDGGLAADGIRTNEQAFGYVVNLRDVRRPQFTVDRKTLRTWDKDWVYAQIQESIPRLLEWPGLTLSWLWQLTESKPAVAQHIFDKLVSLDWELPVEGAWGHGVRVRASQVGCLPRDREVFGRDSWAVGSAAWLSAWRMGVWRGMVPAPAGSALPVPTRLDGYPSVTPFDAEVLDQIHGAALPDVDQVLDIVGHPEQQIVDRLRRLRRYAITGLNLSAIRDVPRLATTIESDDQPLLRALGAWSRPGEPPRRSVGSWLAKASYELNEPLGEVFRRVAELAPDNWVPPAVELGTLGDYVCGEADVALLSRDLDGVWPWTRSELSPAHLMRASASLGRSVGDVLAMCDRLAPLGHLASGRELYPDDVLPVEREALRHVEAVGQLFTPLHLFVIAGRINIGVQEVQRDLARLAETGLLRLPEVRGLPDTTPTSDELALIEQGMYTYGRTRELLAGVLQAGETAWRIYSSRSDETDRRQVQYARLLPFVRPREPVTTAQLTYLAAYIDGDIEEAARHLESLFGGAADLGLPQLSMAARRLRPDWRVRSTMLWNDRRDHPREWRSRPGLIVEGAIEARQSIGDYLTGLEPYRELGGTLPDTDEAARSALAGFVPDRYDASMLWAFREDDDFLDDDDRYVSTVSPLWLVQVAGRFGWTLAETHERMARLEPIGLTLDYPTDGCPDEIVRWQDLLLLTEFLDGQEPAVRGSVSAAHIALAAEETGESVDWIRNRLRHYAPLFGLSLDELGEEGTGD